MEIRAADDGQCCVGKSVGHDFYPDGTPPNRGLTMKGPGRWGRGAGVKAATRKHRNSGCLQECDVASLSMPSAAPSRSAVYAGLRGRVPPGAFRPRRSTVTADDNDIEFAFRYRRTGPFALHEHTVWAIEAPMRSPTRDALDEVAASSAGSTSKESLRSSTSRWP